MSALNEQVGGDHYEKLGLQPFEITFRNFGYPAVRHSAYNKVQKYLTREKGSHRQDIEKSIHVLQIQLEFLDRHEAETVTDQGGKWALKDSQPILNTTESK